MYCEPEVAFFLNMLKMAAITKGVLSKPLEVGNCILLLPILLI